VIDDLDMLARQPDPASVGKRFQQAADDFAQAAQLVGERLMRRVNLAALRDQRGRQSLVEPLEGDCGQEL
jgi:hypothetical protein